MKTKGLGVCALLGAAALVAACNRQGGLGAAAASAAQSPLLGDTTGFGGQKYKIVGCASSSSVSGSNDCSKAVDGNASTYWWANQSDGDWIYFDLGDVRTVKRIVATWNDAVDYDPQISNDGINWTYIDEGDMHDIAGTNDHVFYIDHVMTGRYLRLLGVHRNTGNGYRLVQFDVYGLGLYTEEDVYTRIFPIGDWNMQQTESILIDFSSLGQTNDNPYRVVAMSAVIHSDPDPNNGNKVSAYNLERLRDPTQGFQGIGGALSIQYVGGVKKIVLSRGTASSSMFARSTTPTFKTLGRNRGYLRVDYFQNVPVYE